LLKPKAANEHEEGLLEYLEDIIGTIKYKPMLEEIAVEIDKVNEIRTEKVTPPTFDAILEIDDV
jgi:structural maintenance of chromosome 4